MVMPKRILQKIIGNKRFGGKNDWDFDGVTNKKDCQPRNVMRQDVIGWMKGNAQELDAWKRFHKLKRLGQTKFMMKMDIDAFKRKLELTEDETERRRLRNLIKDKQDILQAIR